MYNFLCCSNELNSVYVVAGAVCLTVFSQGCAQQQKTTEKVEFSLDGCVCYLSLSSVGPRVGQRGLSAAHRDVTVSASSCWVMPFVQMLDFSLNIFTLPAINSGGLI